jgi:hypothetical protein
MYYVFKAIIPAARCPQYQSDAEQVVKLDFSGLFKTIFNKSSGNHE